MAASWQESIFWMSIILGTVYGSIMVVTGCWFFYRRNLQPIKARIPNLVVLTQLCLVIYFAYVIGRGVSRETMPCWVDSFGAHIIVGLVAQFYLLRCWVLYFCFNLTQAKLHGYALSVRDYHESTNRAQHSPSFQSNTPSTGKSSTGSISLIPLSLPTLQTQSNVPLTDRPTATTIGTLPVIPGSDVDGMIHDMTVIDESKEQTSTFVIPSYFLRQTIPEPLPTPFPITKGLTRTSMESTSQTPSPIPPPENTITSTSDPQHHPHRSHSTLGIETSVSETTSPTPSPSMPHATSIKKDEHDAPQHIEHEKPSRPSIMHGRNSSRYQPLVYNDIEMTSTSVPMSTPLRPTQVQVRTTSASPHTNIPETSSTATSKRTSMISPLSRIPPPSLALEPMSSHVETPSITPSTDSTTTFIIPPLNLPTNPTSPDDKSPSTSSASPSTSSPSASTPTTSTPTMGSRSYSQRSLGTKRVSLIPTGENIRRLAPIFDPINAQLIRDSPTQDQDKRRSLISSHVSMDFATSSQILMEQPTSSRISPDHPTSSRTSPEQDKRKSLFISSHDEELDKHPLPPPPPPPSVPAPLFQMSPSHSESYSSIITPLSAIKTTITPTIQTIPLTVMPQSDVIPVTPGSQWFIKKKNMVHWPFLLTCISIGMCIQMIIPIISLFLDTQVRSAVDNSCHQSISRYGLAGTLGFYVLCFLWFSRALAPVTDGFGMKRELKTVAMIGGVTCVIWILFQSLQPLYAFDHETFGFTTLLLATADIMIWTASTIQPLIKTYDPNYVGISHDKMDTLEDILETEAGLQSFRNFLVSEFSVENILFYEEIMAFRGKYGIPTDRNDPSPDIPRRRNTLFPQKPIRNEKRMRADARVIYQKYVVDGSDLQVNLSSSVRATMERRLDAPYKDIVTTHAQHEKYMKRQAKILAKQQHKQSQQPKHKLTMESSSRTASTARIWNKRMIQSPSNAQDDVCVMDISPLHAHNKDILTSFDDENDIKSTSFPHRGTRSTSPSNFMSSGSLAPLPSPPLSASSPPMDPDPLDAAQLYFTCQLFDEAQAQCLGHMKRDHFVRYLNTQMYKALMIALETEKKVLHELHIT